MIGEAGDERAFGRRSSSVQRPSGEGAAGALFAFDGCQSEVRRHALHLLDEPAHDRAAAGETVDAGMVLALSIQDRRQL